MKKWATKTVTIIFLFLIFTQQSFSAITCSPDTKISNRSPEELSEIIKSCESKLKTIRSKINSLSSEIAYMNTQIYLTQLRINKTEKDIKTLEKQIEILNTKIEGLDEYLDKLSKVFIYLAETVYKSRPRPFFTRLLLSKNLNEALLSYKYLKTKQVQNHRLMLQVQRTKLNFEEQKKLREEKTKELEKLTILLRKQKEELKAQQQAKKRLLEITKNDEKEYQRLLNLARKQIAAFKAFVRSAGGGIIPANKFGTGKLGWYYSQRDERWANVPIGNSNMNILEVGCLVTDIAMLYKSAGYNTTPADIARDTSRFFGNTAYMITNDGWRNPLGAYTEISKSQIDKELEKGRKVVVGVYAGKYGTHFIILAGKENGDYIMYDPYYGPDLKFSEKYSFSSIYKAVVFK